jgi:hypothetical protein
MHILHNHVLGEWVYIRQIRAVESAHPGKYTAILESRMCFRRIRQEFKGASHVDANK